MYNERNIFDIDFIQLLYEIKKHIVMVVLVTILGGGVMFAYSTFILKPVYSSTSKLYLLSQSISVTSAGDLSFGDAVSNDYKLMVTSRTVLNTVIKNLNLDYSYGTLAGMISVDNPSSTRMLNITVKCGDAEQAADIANELAQVAKRQVADMMKVDEPMLFETAVVNNNPVAPNKRKNVMQGLLAGFILACIIVAVRYMLNDTIKNEAALESLLNINVLASIPNEKPHRLRISNNISASGTKSPEE